LSKLADKIRNVQRLQGQALGFGAGRGKVEPTMVLAAGARGRGRRPRRKGADVVILGSPARWSHRRQGRRTS
jgi:hypothetical protein